MAARTRSRRTRRALCGAIAASALLVACSGARLPTSQDVATGDRAGAPGDRDATSATTTDLTAPTTTPVSLGADGKPVPSGSGPSGVTTTVPQPLVPGGFISTLFHGSENTAGITKQEIRLCAHAALTYAAAFNTSEDDLNVYWSAINDAGGIYGRKVNTYYENDNYTPEDAVKAATACKTKHDPFMLIGGIGFDQIPAVRNWAEQQRMLYLHHTATVKGSENKQFSFTALPTTEKAGEMFAELMLWKMPGKTVGIIKRQSENWEPGVDGFKRIAKAHGIKIVLDRPVPQNKGSYLQDITALKSAHADVVWVWLNALETVQFVKQAKAQQLDATFMVFPFNLEAQTLKDDALNPPLIGIAMWNAYSKGDYSGPFAPYADDIRQFEQQYAKYRPSVKLGGVGGDLLFLNWQGQKAMHQLLLGCGPDCTRNHFLELLHDFDKKVTSSSCNLDFTRPGAGNNHRGGWVVAVQEAYRAPSGQVNMRNVRGCVEHLI
jgi:ABC-type branched-subunit amino acid transport system substrate-binding protein